MSASRFSGRVLHGPAAHSIAAGVHAPRAGTFDGDADNAHDPGNVRTDLVITRSAENYVGCPPDKY
jgi:hypothetical protein